MNMDKLFKNTCPQDVVKFLLKDRVLLGRSPVIDGDFITYNDQKVRLGWGLLEAIMYHSDKGIDTEITVGVTFKQGGTIHETDPDVDQFWIWIMNETDEEVGIKVELRSHSVCYMESFEEIDKSDHRVACSAFNLPMSLLTDWLNKINK